MFPINFLGQSDKGQGHSDCDKAAWGACPVLQTDSCLNRFISISSFTPRETTLNIRLASFSQ